MINRYPRSEFELSHKDRFLEHLNDEGLMKYKRAYMTLAKGENAKRDLNISVDYLSEKSWSMRDLALKYGVSASRIGDIIAQHARFLCHPSRKDIVMTIKHGSQDFVLNGGLD